jgi:hypothetical protein
MAAVDPDYFAAALFTADPDVCRCAKEAAAGASTDLFVAKWVKCK